MTYSPIAIIRAVRVYYSLGRLPGKAKIVMDQDEEMPQKYPVLEGWNVPGDYGWRVIRVSQTDDAMLTKIHVRQ